jgi:hypothetical protein
MTNTTLIAMGVGLFVLALAMPVHAQTWNVHKTTRLTFDSPVMLPGVTLAPGTYLFERIDPNNTNVLMVRSVDRRSSYGLVMTIPRVRQDASAHHVLAIGETPEGIAPALKAWFYPGERNGQEFVYPKEQARYIVKWTDCLLDSGMVK